MKRIIAAFLFLAAPAQAEFVLQLPLGAQETYGKLETTLPAMVPVGPSVDGTVPTADAPATIRRTVWQLGPEQTVQGAERSIVEQLDRRGYEVVFDCVAQACGGFDFRFGIDVVAEPMMRVDLRDFRFITAKQAVTENPAFVTFLISRSPVAVFVQLTEYHPQKTAEPVVEIVQDDETALKEPSPTPEPEGRVVLEGLQFKSGSVEIEADPDGVLTALAGLLQADPALSVLLVGHSDMSGTIEGNLNVSKARANAVRDMLINEHGVDGNRLSAHGVGFLSPRASNDTENGRQKNRRVEAVFSR